MHKEAEVRYGRYTALYRLEEDFRLMYLGPTSEKAVLCCECDLLNAVLNRVFRSLTSFLTICVFSLDLLRSSYYGFVFPCYRFDQLCLTA